LQPKILVSDGGVGGQKQSGDAGGGQCFGIFNGGNVQKPINFSGRPEALSQWPDYSVHTTQPS